MATVKTNDAYYAAIADAIRAKTGSTDTYTPAQMAAAIQAIQTGGEGSGDDATYSIEVWLYGRFEYCSIDVYHNGLCRTLKCDENEDCVTLELECKKGDIIVLLPVTRTSFSVSGGSCFTNVLYSQDLFVGAVETDGAIDVE